MIKYSQLLVLISIPLFYFRQKIIPKFIQTKYLQAIDSH